MPIDATCPHCQKQFQLTDDHAGRLLLCSQCQSSFSVPEPGRQPDTTVIPPPRLPQFPPTAPPPNNRPRVAAAKFCYALGILCVLSFLFFGLVALMFNNVTASPEYLPAKNALVTAFAILTFAFLLIGSIYLACARFIRDGNPLATRIILIVTLLQLFGTLINLIHEVFLLGSGEAAPSPSALIPPTPISLLSIAAALLFLLLHTRLLLHLTIILNDSQRKRSPHKLAAAVAAAIPSRKTTPAPSTPSASQ